MNWTVLVAFCIIDDLLKAPGHKDDPQSKTPAGVVLTIRVLAALFSLACCKEHALFSFIPSGSRFCRRLHSLSHGIPHLLPLCQSLWQHLSSTQHCILDTFPLPVCENLRAPWPQA